MGAIHEEAPVKIGSEMFAGFPNHPFGITRHNGAPLIKIRSLPFMGGLSALASAVHPEYRSGECGWLIGKGGRAAHGTQNQSMNTLTLISTVLGEIPLFFSAVGRRKRAKRS